MDEKTTPSSNGSAKGKHQSMNLVQQLFFNEQATNNAPYDVSFANSAKSMSNQRWAVSRYLYCRYVSRNTFISMSVSIKCFTTVSVSIQHVFVHRRYTCLDTVFEQDQSYQVLTACSFKVSEECEMKLNSLIDSKRRTVRKLLLLLAYSQFFYLFIFI